MKILIIGNGFDIAHSLNTRYVDFHEFVERFEKEYEKKDLIPEDAIYRAAIGNPANETFARLELLSFDNMIHKEPQIGDFFHQCVSDNIIFEYFSNQIPDSEFKWMDYEKEIENLIITIDDHIGTESAERQVEIGLPQAIDSFIIKKMTERDYTPGIANKEYIFSYVKLLSRLSYDLNRLTNALETYMVYYVEECNWKDDTSHRGRSKYKPLSYFKDVDKLLSFNFTDTFQRQYSSAVDSCFVHGKACIKQKELFSGRSQGSLVKRVPSIVLGISDDNEDGELQFKASESLYYDFQKFMLRERYGDKHWIDWIKNDGEKKEIHIVGHSLTYSDKDILEKFLLLPESSPGSIVNIYYIDENARNDLQKNLVKMIGKTKFKELCRNGIMFKPVSDVIRYGRR